jgi:hypothetical protein
MVEVVHFAVDNKHESNMESISGVEREIDKVLSKFTGINEHADRVLQDLSRSIESLKNELDTGKLRIMTSDPINRCHVRSRSYAVP